MGSKRGPEGDAAVNPQKVAKLEEDRVAALPFGANLVEFDGKSCTHEVAWPPGEDGSPLPPPAREGPPAREYPFKIDPFQQTAINCLEAGAWLLGCGVAAVRCRSSAPGAPWRGAGVRPVPAPAS